MKIHIHIHVNIEVFQEMIRQGVARDVITYNTLINACARENLSERAQLVFNAMKRQGVVPDDITYSSLISAYASTNQTRQGRGRDDGIDPKTLIAHYH